MNKALQIIDGGTGSELERRGVDTSLPLWSARAVLDAPDVLAQIHREYLEAGADAITANTFRTHGRSLAKTGLGDRAKDLTKRAVEVAQRVRDAVNPRALVLGSVAPLEDCYTPTLAPAPEECAREHGEMIKILVESGVDFLLIETMNNLAEAKAAMEIARERAPGRWITSFCVASGGPLLCRRDLKPGATASEAQRSRRCECNTRDQGAGAPPTPVAAAATSAGRGTPWLLQNGGPPGILLSGEPLESLCSSFAGAYAIGINCVPAPEMESQLRRLHALLPDDVRLLAYANVGRADPIRGWTNTDAVSPERYAEYARHWLDAGATIIGGCCGTTPATIRALAALRAPATS